MELKLGQMTNQELADWFGIKLSSFKNSKKNKLKELESFAAFEANRNGADIKEIYNSVVFSTF